VLLIILKTKSDFPVRKIAPTISLSQPRLPFRRLLFNFGQLGDEERRRAK
jgi:hypothetical protein